MIWWYLGLLWPLVGYISWWVSWYYDPRSKDYLTLGDLAGGFLIMGVLGPVATLILYSDVVVIIRKKK
jgi:hypothetical protein